MNRAVTLGLLLTVVVVALVLRCPQPDARPMHSDEAVNAIKFRELWEHGSYKYDSSEFHGPTLPYLTLAWAKLTGAPVDFNQFSEARFRALTVTFGIGLILLLPLVADGLGRRATVGAGLLIAVSPAMVFYSRYYIHEMLLVFFTFLALAAGWRYTQSHKIGWALLTGAAIGLMQATKETFVFSLVATALALALNEFWRRRIDAATVPAPFKFNFKHFAAAAIVWLAVAFILFSSFFTNPSGPMDSLRTYLPWTHRVQGASPHIHPWNFYLSRLIFFHPGKGPVWSEGLILILGVIGIVAVFRHKLPAGSNANFIRFLVFYTLILTAIYSVIPYKTPWCLLNFWHGMILMAGVGAMTLVERASSRRRKLAFAALLFIGAGQLSLEAWQAAVRYPAMQGNPYAYAQTSPDVTKLVDQVEALSQAHPLGHGMVVEVMAPESGYWPLPWYLRSYKNAGWWAEVPLDPFAPVMIVSTKFQANLDEKKTHLMVGIFELRPTEFFELYVEAGLWREYLRAHKPTEP